MAKKPKSKPKTPKTKGDKLTLSQSLFCYFYTGLYFNNAVRSYAAAYKIDLSEYDRLSQLISAAVHPSADILNKFEVELARYKVAASGGKENLEKPLIQNRIREMLLKRFGNFEEVDARLSEIIFGGDHTVSVAAIREFNKLKARIVDQKNINLKGTFSLTDLLKAADEEKEA